MSEVPLHPKELHTEKYALRAEWSLETKSLRWVAACVPRAGGKEIEREREREREREGERTRKRS